MPLSMTQMGQNPAFAPFLGATIGEDTNGTNVTVLSMLARLGIDPWTEASDLAAMPERSARKRLDTLMAHFKDVPTLGSDRDKIISALLAFLPKTRAVANPTSQGDEVKLALPPIGAPIYWIILAALVVGWVTYLAQGQ